MPPSIAGKSIYILANKCRIAYGLAHLKKHFKDINLTMDELCHHSVKSFNSQLGFIEFT